MRDPVAAAVSWHGAHLNGGVMKQNQFDRRTFLIDYMLQTFK
jgi:hypothetical protein